MTAVGRINKVNKVNKVNGHFGHTGRLGYLLISCAHLSPSLSSKIYKNAHFNGKNPQKMMGEGAISWLYGRFYLSLQRKCIFFL